MKKFIIRAIIISAFAGGFTATIASAITYGVKYTPHNLGATGEGRFAGPSATTETEICVYCHTPHNAVEGKTWLWNRTGATTDFRMYTSSSTLNFTKGVAIGETSKMCMTCHDGVTAMNAMANPRPGTQSTQMGDVWSLDQILNDWKPNIGEQTNDGGPTGSTIPGAANLTNDHPISFDYVESYNAESANGTLRSINTVKSRGLQFWGANGQMLECVTCHDPHVNYGCWDSTLCNTDGTGDENHTNGNPDYSLLPFLRRNNHSSGLCFTCHNK